MWDTKIEITKEEDFKCPLLGGEKPEVHFNQKTLDKMKYLCQRFPDLEWMAGLLGKKEKGNKGQTSYIIEDIYLIEQEIAHATVEATNKGRKQLAETPNTIGWIHSHNTMSSFQSTTDYDTAHNYDLTMTTNNKEEITGISKEIIECPKTKAIVMKEVDIYVPTTEIEKDESLEKEIAEKLKEKVYAANEYKIETKNEKNEIVEVGDYEGFTCTCCHTEIGKKDEITTCPTCMNPCHEKCLKETGYECALCQEVREYRLTEIQDERIEKEEAISWRVI